ncbi:MAG: nickel-dependent lactate racemase [Clostridia bacterium]|nr:nickel-dependent lactate racemase [Clostridia bacterium]
MSVVGELCRASHLPKMIKVKQKFKMDCIQKEDIRDKVFEQLGREEIKSQIRPKMRVAITCGSRGIANIARITKAIADFVKQCDAEPFVIAAMGSHGGATAEGQKEVLFSYGVTEEYVGCEIISSMQTIPIGQTEEGHTVYIDKNAKSADAIIVCGRIKAHTGFHGDYESGLMKMMAIGLGKQQGAEVCHESGFKNMARLIPIFGNCIREKSNIICGLGIIENAFDQTHKIIALTNEEIPCEEPKLLLEAKSLMGKLYFENTDVLVVDRIGKNISGDGMDPNVTGTFGTPYATGGIKAERVVVLDLTEETHGNANGIGMADITTKRLVDKMNIDITYPNAITSTLLCMVKIPLFTSNDREAVQLALKNCTEADKENPRIIRIKDTMHLEYIYISEQMLEEAKNNPNLEIVDTSKEWDFDERGNMW